MACECPTANTALVLVVQSLSFSLYDKHYGHCVFLYYRENFLFACGGAVGPLGYCH